MNEIKKGIVPDEWPIPGKGRQHHEFVMVFLIVETKPVWRAHCIPNDTHLNGWDIRWQGGTFEKGHTNEIKAI
ncbi:MAG: hypothetical protein ACE5EM_06380 [Sphingomonadales bacterium]